MTRPAEKPCKRCGAPILWVHRHGQAPFPVDARPSPTGRHELYVDDDDRLRSRFLTKSRARDLIARAGSVHNHHRLTCNPNRRLP